MTFVRCLILVVSVGTFSSVLQVQKLATFPVAGEANLLNGAIFKEKRMRDYLKLQAKAGEEASHLQSLNGKFPEGKYLCIIGSDYNSYGAVKRVTGNHSDGLVKQDPADIKGAYRAYVHRAHSGRKAL